MHIHKNDKVKINIGKDKGKTGKVLSVRTKEGKILLEGLNMFKKHVRPKRQGEKGQIVEVPRPVDISNVMLVCSTCGESTRVGFREEGGKKTRYCKKCNALI
jgi:large subunit ribosomal protein L24